MVMIHRTADPDADSSGSAPNEGNVVFRSRFHSSLVRGANANAPTQIWIRSCRKSATRTRRARSSRRSGSCARRRGTTTPRSRRSRRSSRRRSRSRRTPWRTFWTIRTARCVRLISPSRAAPFVSLFRRLAALRDEDRDPDCFRGTDAPLVWFVAVRDGSKEEDEAGSGG
jgi:hypothetical protein